MRCTLVHVYICIVFFDTSLVVKRTSLLSAHPLLSTYFTVDIKYDLLSAAHSHTHTTHYSRVL